MASVLKRFLDLTRLSERFTISVRHSSRLGCTNNQSSRVLPLGFLKSNSEGYHVENIPPTVKDTSAFPNVFSGPPVIKKIEPPIMPYGHVRNFDLPTFSSLVSLEVPTVKSLLDNVQITPDKIKIEAPQQGQVIEKMAHRMLVIRRKKMKKHKLRKFRKKFRVLLFTRAKKRNAIKETVFANEVLGILLKAEAFDPKQYVDEKLKKAYEPLPVKPELLKPLPWEFRPIFANSKKKK